MRKSAGLSQGPRPCRCRKDLFGPSLAPEAGPPEGAKDVERLSEEYAGEAHQSDAGVALLRCPLEVAVV